MKEIWKDVAGYEGYYMVSDLGNVKSLNYNHTKKHKILANCINSSGYCNVSLYRDRLKKQFSVHQLVAMSFHNHTPKGHTKVVNHINFNKSDNRAINLEIVTVRENSNLMHKPSSSKYVGVSWDTAASKWRSRIVIDGFDKSLGMFKNEHDAHLAYQKELSFLEIEV